LYGLLQKEEISGFGISSFATINDALNPYFINFFIPMKVKFLFGLLLCFSSSLYAQQRVTETDGQGLNKMDFFYAGEGKALRMYTKYLLCLNIYCACRWRTILGLSINKKKGAYSSQLLLHILSFHEKRLLLKL
jgi:hypothetical protein